ncbi:hypothetical protein B0H10DRAFT_1975307 [Mycena sp. CBHHK59/15]|nr:hypothetical protein B0H10DRAFT_1975307 [Mycena sp. CBHHK59/15]
MPSFPHPAPPAQVLPPPSHDWKVPGVSIPPPLTVHPLPETITPWDRLQFTPTGAYEVRRHLGAEVGGEYGRFNRSQEKFFAADMAWLAANSSDDGQHKISPDTFFPEFHHLRDSVPQGEEGQKERKAWSARNRRLLWDLATMWDRCTGGTTMILHVDGTTIPGAPLVPERLKAHVYMPPHFIAEHPEAHTSIAFISQTFLEQIGIPTANSWTHRAKRLWNLTQRGHLRAVQIPTVLVPHPVHHCSAYYVFPGRPMGQLTIAGPVPPLAPAAAPHVSGEYEDLPLYDIDEITTADTELALVSANERAGQLDIENQQLRDTIDTLQIYVQTLTSDFESREEAYKAELDLATAHVEQLERELRALRVGILSPRTPQSSHPPYVAPSPFHLTSPSAFRTTPQSSAPVASVLAGNAATQTFLESHLLMELSESVGIIARLLSPVKWADELGHLASLNPEYVEGLLEAMHQDRCML